MKRIYLDNAATSFPKAPGISYVIKRFLEEECINPNRTNTIGEFSLFERINALREMICTMYHYPHPDCTILSSGATASLNQVIKGLFTANDHVIVSSAEHNSVMRPLVQSGIPFSRIPCDRHGYLMIEEIESLIRNDTKAMVICAAGNVSGAVQDIHAIADIAQKHNTLLFIDCAQATPYVDIDMENDRIAGVCFAGHKGLLGPEGVGGMVLRKDIAMTIAPLISGGTGSQSDSEQVPTTLPDRLESGTQNIPGILALAESVSFVESHRHELWENEQKMTRLLYNGLEDIDGITIVGAPLNRPRTSVISVTSDRMDIAQISARLSEQYNIDTRVGMHCSPSSHKTLGTFPTGTLRFSPGPFTTEYEIMTTINAMKEILG